MPIPFLRIFPDGYALVPVEPFLDESRNLLGRPHLQYCSIQPPCAVNEKLRRERLEIASYDKLNDFRKHMNPLDDGEREDSFTLSGESGPRCMDTMGVLALHSDGTRFVWINRHGEEGIVHPRIGFCSGLYRAWVVLGKDAVRGAFGILVSPALE